MYCNIRIRKKGVIITALCLTAVILGSVLALHAPQAAVVSARSGEAVKLPILMYHSMLKDSKLQGKYVISPDLFESDLKYIKEHGYTTVVMQDLIDYVHGGTLPEKPIMLTFDDGYYNNYLYAYPLLQKYDCKMVLSPIGRYADQYTETPDTHASYAHASWEMLKEMVDSGYVELQNHSYNMHSNSNGRKGTKKNKGESEEAYKQAFTEDVSKAQQRFTEQVGITPTCFTYPFGAISNVSLDYLKEMGFQATLTCESKMNELTQEPDALYGLNRFLRTNQGTSEQFFAKILK